MHQITTDELINQPEGLLACARRGEPALVTDHGKTIFMAVPMGEGVDPRDVRAELATHLFDAEQVGLGGAAAIAGLSISEMIEELGKRKITVVRITPEELDEELAYFRTLVDRG